MDWAIAGVIVAIIGVILMWLFFYLPRREKVEVTYSDMSVQLLETNGTITDIIVKCAFSLLYSKGTRECYISETWLKLDMQVWKKLRLYFNKLPRWIGGIPCSEGLKKLERGKPQMFGIDFSSPISRVITDDERKELNELVQELWHHYRIGWEDTYGRTHCKTINQLRDIKRSFKSAM